MSDKILNQNFTPLASELLKYRKDRHVRFDVPGHKGKSFKDMCDFFSKRIIELDVNSSKFLDNLSHPTGIIRQAEELAAKAFGSKYAFFMTNGTTSSVQAMIMCSVKENEKIILPRNVHKSVINSLIITGAIPVYVQPFVYKNFGVSVGVTKEAVKNSIKKNKDAVAILINNPTYYGFCSDVSEIVKLAHENSMKVLADEAHGTHFYFSLDHPFGAIKLGADMAAVSIHKTGGSLTQSSILLSNELNNLRQIINLTQTTSPSYLLLASLDIARRELFLNGKKILKKMLNLANYARKEIETIGTYKVFDEKLISSEIFDFDLTKLSINTHDVGLAGIEVYDILRDEYNIQIEFGDMNNILAIISHADRELEIERLVGALAEIKRLYQKSKKGLFDHEYIDVEVIITPKEAFYGEKISIPIQNAINKISAESLMCYPPGIPILAPGEKITREIIDYIMYAKEKGSLLTGTVDMNIETIYVVK